MKKKECLLIRMSHDGMQPVPSDSPTLCAHAAICHSTSRRPVAENFRDRAGSRASCYGPLPTDARTNRHQAQRGRGLHGRGSQGTLRWTRVNFPVPSVATLRHSTYKAALPFSFFLSHSHSYPPPPPPAPLPFTFTFPFLPWSIPGMAQRVVYANMRAQLAFFKVCSEMKSIQTNRGLSCALFQPH